MSFIYNVRLRFVDTDASGRIHYSAMFRYFEEAETEFFRELGMPYSTLETAETSYPRAHAACDYLSAIVSDDPMRIAVNVEKVGNSSFTIGFDVTVRDVPVARGRIVVVMMSRATQKSCALPSRLREVLESARIGDG